MQRHRLIECRTSWLSTLTGLSNHVLLRASVGLSQHLYLVESFRQSHFIRPAHTHPCICVYPHRQLQKQKQEMQEAEFLALHEAGLNPYEVYRRRDIEAEVSSHLGGDACAEASQGGHFVMAAETRQYYWSAVCTDASQISHDTGMEAGLIV